MPTNINLGKKLGVAGQTNIQLPSGPPAFVDNKSFEFDGATSYFNGGFIPYTELDGATKAAFSFWIKPTSSTFRTIFAVGTTATAGEAQILCFADASNRIRVNITDTTNTMSTDINALQPNYWNHVFIAVNFSGPSAIYIDGINKTNTVNIGALSAFATSKGSFYLGEDQNSYQGKFLGLINEFAVWSGQDYINSFGILFNEGLPRDLNNLPLNPIGQATPPPTTWFRCGESSTWNGSKWTMADVNGGYNLQSIAIAGPPTQPSPDVPLFNNKSFSFDGTSDYITLGNPVNLRILGSVTVSAWVKYTDNGGTRYINNFGDKYGLYINGGLLIWHYRNPANQFKTVASTINFNDGNWHHVVGVNDGTNLKIYIDGVLNNSNTDGSSGIAGTSDSRIGARWTNLNHFEGGIDELAVWDSALTDGGVSIGQTAGGQIAEIYNNGIAKDISNLSPLGWWRIGEDALYDSGLGLWSFPDNGSGGNNGSSLTLPESARVSDVPT